MTLREEILEQVGATGPIPFDDFMRLSLYHPVHGFFSSDRLRSERGGDFLTSPEVSPLFGETLAGYVTGELERIGEPFEVVEVGAGSGSLLAPLLSRVGVEATAVEASPAARRSLSLRLPEVTVTDTMPATMRGVVIANELVDNLPMALAQRLGGRWRERWVGIDGDRLSFVDAEPRPGVLSWLESFAGEVPDGGWVEAQLEACTWMVDVLDRLVAGSLLVFDYGDTAENLVPRRRDGTLRTYRSHHLGPHPLDEPGETDITADVNFTSLRSCAERAGAMVAIHRQDDFLIGLGLRDRLSRLRHDELETARDGDEMRRLELRSMRTEAETLLHPRGLGDFRVLAAVK